MTPRITAQNAVDSAIRQAGLRQQSIANLQHQLSTGLRISRPSDSPGDWGTLTANKSTVGRMNVDLENISTVRQRLNQSVSNLTEVGNILTRARELALGAAQSDQRETLALEVDRLIDSMLAAANAADGGVQLYSGTASATRPFEVTQVDEFGRPKAVEYRGAIDRSEVLVGPGTTAVMLPTGAEVFQQSSRGPTQYIGETGASQGDGTDSAKGVGEFVVRHSATMYASGGVLAGASSVGGDTIVGSAGTHTLTIELDTAGNQTVRLNDGQPFSFNGSSTDLRVVGGPGEQVYVDMSGVAPGFVGEVAITADATVSIDGTTQIPADFTTSQVFRHGETGEVVVANTANLRIAGTDRLEFSNTNGVFESLIQLRDDLRNSDGLGVEELLTVMDARIEDIERAHSQVIDFVGEQSVELSNLETLENRLRELRLSTQETVIEMESADMADVIVRLQAEQNHLQFIYAATASLNQVNLLDFIR